MKQRNKSTGRRWKRVEEITALIPADVCSHTQTHSHTLAHTHTQRNRYAHTGGHTLSLLPLLLWLPHVARPSHLSLSHSRTGSCTHGGVRLHPRSYEACAIASLTACVCVSGTKKKSAKSRERDRKYSRARETGRGRARVRERERSASSPE